jgi:hypothetical protein
MQQTQLETMILLSKAGSEFVSIGRIGFLIGGKHVGSCNVYCMNNISLAFQLRKETEENIAKEIV